MENYNVSSNITRTTQNLSTKKINDLSNAMLSEEYSDVANVEKITDVNIQSIDINEKNANSYKDLLRKILESAKDFPELLEALKKILLNDQFIDVNIKPNDELNAIFENFMKLIQMDKIDILDFIKFQSENYSKFSGDFFSFLKVILKENPNFQVKELISNFLKNYDCFLTAKETMSATSNILNRILESLPAKLQQQLVELVDKLNSNILSPDKIVPQKEVLQEIISDKIVPQKEVLQEIISDKTVPQKEVLQEIISDKAVPDKIISEKNISDILKSLPEECKKELTTTLENIKTPLKSKVLNDEILPILQKHILNPADLAKIKEQITNLIASKYNNASVKENDIDSKNIINPKNLTLIDPKSEFKNTNYMENIDSNVAILKNEIIPFLLNINSSKLNLTSDNVKDLISLLIHNVLRLDTGTKNNFDYSVDSLFEYLKTHMKLDDKKIADLKVLLNDNIKQLSNLKNEPLDYLLKLANEGLKEGNSNGCKVAFQNLLQAMLINNDVKTPFMHLFVPLSNKNGFMFSEIWIGKTTSYNSNKKSSKNSDDSDDGSILLITVDINNFGYFELVVLFENNQVDMDIYVPTDLSTYRETIKSNIDNIIKNNNIDLRKISVSVSDKRKKLSDVFPKTEFKSNNINVKV